MISQLNPTILFCKQLMPDSDSLSQLRPTVESSLKIQNFPFKLLFSGNKSQQEEKKITWKIFRNQKISRRFRQELFSFCYVPI